MKMNLFRSCAAITVAGAMLFASNVSMADTVMDRDNNVQRGVQKRIGSDEKPWTNSVRTFVAFSRSTS